MLQTLGIQVRLQGAIQPGLLLVANHVSWLDVIVMHSLCPEVRFVAKADVLRWPVIGSPGTGCRYAFRPAGPAANGGSDRERGDFRARQWWHGDGLPKAQRPTALRCCRFAPVSFRPCSPEMAPRSRSPALFRGNTFHQPKRAIPGRRFARTEHLVVVSCSLCGGQSHRVAAARREQR